jgi:hypothetical protein
LLGEGGEYAFVELENILLRESDRISLTCFDGRDSRWIREIEDAIPYLD